MSEGGADHGADFISIEAQLSEAVRSVQVTHTGGYCLHEPFFLKSDHGWHSPVKSVEVLVNDVGEAVATEIEMAEA